MMEKASAEESKKERVPKSARGLKTDAFKTTETIRKKVNL